MLDVEKIEYKKLADMENIKATVKETIESGKINEFKPDWENMVMQEAELITYIDQDASGIPAWDFTIMNDDTLETASMLINASTGEFICFE